MCRHVVELVVDANKVSDCDLVLAAEVPLSRQGGHARVSEIVGP